MHDFPSLHRNDTVLWSVQVPSNDCRRARLRSTAAGRRDSQPTSRIFHTTCFQNTADWRISDIRKASPDLSRVMNCGYPATLHRLSGSSPRQTWVQSATLAHFADGATVFLAPFAGAYRLAPYPFEPTVVSVSKLHAPLAQNSKSLHAAPRSLRSKMAPPPPQLETNCARVSRRCHHIQLR